MSKFSIDYGDDFEYAQSRLRETVVMHKDGFPILVSNINGHGEVHAYQKSTAPSLYDGPLQVFSLKDLDLQPVKLGFANTKRGISYTFRMPTRHYKQGLNYHNYRSVGAALPFHMSAVADTIMGIYPKATQCLEAVICEEVSARAFSRDFAFGKITKAGASLFFRNKKVGTATPSEDGNNINFHLSEDKMFLQEMLEESINV